MSLKQELLKKVPQQLKDEPQFNALLDHIKQHQIESKEHLTNSLRQEIVLLEKWMEDYKNLGETAVKSVRNKAVHLDALKKCEELTKTFLEL